MKLELKLWPDPILKKQCSDVDPTDPEILPIIDRMVAFMFAHQGRGLAAPQIGLDWNMFVVSLGDNQEPRVIVNPEMFVDEDTEIVATEEGCLSIPGIKAKLNCRFKAVNIVCSKPKSHDVIAVTLYGDEAITFQHEYDHLQGITIFDRMGPTQRMMAKKKYDKLVKKYSQLTTMMQNADRKVINPDLNQVLQNIKNNIKGENTNE